MKPTLRTAAVLALAAAGFAVAAQAATIYTGDGCPVPEGEYAE